MKPPSPRRKPICPARTNGNSPTELDRAANLVKEQAIAQRLYDERANAKRVADAAVQAAEAELKQAEPISITPMSKPHHGAPQPRGSRAGNLVQADPTPRC
jgi:multidrug efflux system membrane fusion protein